MQQYEYNKFRRNKALFIATLNNIYIESRAAVNFFPNNKVLMCLFLEDQTTLFLDIYISEFILLFSLHLQARSDLNKHYMDKILFVY